VFRIHARIPFRVRTVFPFGLRLRVADFATLLIQVQYIRIAVAYRFFKYELIARRTTSAKETFSRLAAAFNLLICPGSISAINLVSFMCQPYHVHVQASRLD